MTTTPLPRRAFLKRLAIGCAALAAAPALSALAAHVPTDDDRFATALKTGRVIGGRYVLTKRHRRHDNVVIMNADLTLDPLDLDGTGSRNVIIEACRFRVKSGCLYMASPFGLASGSVCNNHFDFSYAHQHHSIHD